MASMTDYLNKLVSQKNALADNLVTKGIEATHDETLETLVPKVLDISSSGQVITPAKLGYVSGAQYFFDGIYTFPNKHADTALAWIDIANDNVMTRTAGNVYDDHYDKLSGSR